VLLPDGAPFTDHGQQTTKVKAQTTVVQPTGGKMNNPQEQILNWLTSNSGELPRIALEEPEFTARFVLGYFVRQVNKGGVNLSVARIAELLGKLNVPEAAWALGLIWLWPRRISSGHFRDILSRVNADSPSSLMLRLFREAGGQMEKSFRLAGSTVQADPSSVSALHGILLERAMIAGIRFDKEAWLHDIVGKLQQPLLWSAYEDDTLTDISYGPLTQVQPDRPPWQPFQDTALLVQNGHRFWVVKHQRKHRGKTKVGICHPVELATARRNALRDAISSEPFEQIHRKVYHAQQHPFGARIVTSFRDRDIEDFHVFSNLRNRGWRRGQIMDFGRFFEMSLTIPELDWKPYVRLFPGITASGPEGSLQYIHALAFLRNSVGEVPWGNDFMSHTAVVFDGKPHAVTLYLDAPRKPDRSIALYAPQMLWGEELSKVPPVVYSETLRTFHQLMDKHGIPCAHPVTNSSRFFELKASL